MKIDPKTFCEADIFEMGIGQVVIARYKSGGRVEIGVFLIDVHCLGVKDAFYVLTDEAGLEQFLRDIYSGDRKMGQYSAAWGRKLVEEAMGYARKLGFAPHRDYKKAARVMGGINPKDCEETFVFGMNGKPFFLGGPRDTQAKCERILGVLTKKCGQDGFHFMIPASDEDRLGMTEDLADKEWEKEEKNS